MIKDHRCNIFSLCKIFISRFKQCYLIAIVVTFLWFRNDSICGELLPPMQYPVWLWTLNFGDVHLTRCAGSHFRLSVISWGCPIKQVVLAPIYIGSLFGGCPIKHIVLDSFICWRCCSDVCSVSESVYVYNRLSNQIRTSFPIDYRK